MESKQLTRKLNSIFWWVLMALPIIEYIGFIIMKIVNLNTQGGSPLGWNELFNYFVGGDNGFAMFLDSGLFEYNFTDLMPTFIVDGFTSLLDVFGVGNNYFGYILAWVFTIQVYHVILDLLLFVVRWAHDLMERGVK